MVTLEKESSSSSSGGCVGQHAEVISLWLHCIMMKVVMKHTHFSFVLAYTHILSIGLRQSTIMSLHGSIPSDCPVAKARLLSIWCSSVDISDVGSGRLGFRHGQSCQLMATLEDAEIPLGTVDLLEVNAAAARRNTRMSRFQQHTRQPPLLPRRLCLRCGCVSCHLLSPTLETSLNPLYPEQMKHFNYFRVPSSSSWCIVRLLGCSCRDGRC